MLCEYHNQVITSIWTVGSWKKSWRCEACSIEEGIDMLGTLLLKLGCYRSWIDGLHVSQIDAQVRASVERINRR